MAKSKRANGEGSLTYDEKKQLYRGMITTPQGNRLTKSSKNEDIVKDWLNEQRLLIGRGRHIEPHGLTLGEWLQEWLKVYVMPSVKPRTYDRYVSLANHAKPIWNVKLTSLLPAHLQKLYNALLAVLAPRTVKGVHFCLRGALKQAVINQLIYSNPADGVRLPKVKDVEIAVFTAKEIKAIFKAAENHRYPVIVLLAYTTGMRMSECLGLRWEYVDTKKGTVRVYQTVSKSILRGTELSEPKTKNSRRVIPVPADTITALTAHKLKYGIKSGLMFPTENGTPMHATHYSVYIFDRIKKDAGITKGFHTFRHTHASELLAAGVPVVDVSRRLGHARVSTTLDVYGHLIPSSESKVTAAVTKLLKAKKQA